MAQPRQRLAEDRPGGHLREVGVDDFPRHSEVAAELYQARFRRGVDLALVANELRIHYEQLLALEEGRFDDLPGPTYVIGFLRSYAGYLNLDADDLVRRFKDETAYRDSRSDLTFPSPQDEGRVPTGALIALSLALVGAAYGGWHYVASVDRVTLEKVPAVPPTVIVEAVPEAAPPFVETIGESLAVAATEQADASPTEPQEPAPEVITGAAPEAVVDIVEAEAEPVVVATPEPEPEPAATDTVMPQAIEVEEPEVAELEIVERVIVEPAPEIIEPIFVEPVTTETDVSQAVEAEPEAPAPQPEVTASLMPAAPVIDSDVYVPREFGMANAGSIIRLRAQLESWIQVTGADNELLVTRILRPGDIYHVPNRPNLVLMTGNAGGIEILVGEQVAPALGAVGAIQRRVALDPEKLLAGTATN
ncbi:MAG: RodZ domain-containing protein [Alphaproteobacteria bacterium]